MSSLNIENLYDNMQEKIVQDICEDDKLNSIWKELNENQMSY